MWLEMGHSQVLVMVHSSLKNAGGIHNTKKKKRLSSIKCPSNSNSEQVFRMAGAPLNGINTPVCFHQCFVKMSALQAGMVMSLNAVDCTRSPRQKIFKLN